MEKKHTHTHMINDHDETATKTTQKVKSEK